MDTERIRKYPRLRKYGPLAGAALLIAGAIVWAMTSAGSTTYRASRQTIMQGVAEQGEFNEYVRLAGRVETGTVVQISALETGIVQTKAVEEGAMVNVGDIILSLHNPMLRQQILDSESQLAEKQNMLRDTEIAMEKERLQLKQDLLGARTDLNRKERAANTQKALYAEDLTSREEYLKAQEDLQLARESLKLIENRLHQDSLYRSVQLAMMRESLHNMQENFTLVRQRADNLNIRASHSGQLGTLNAEIGQNIGAGQLVGQINILDNYKLTANIDEHYIDRITPGVRGRIDRQNHALDVVVSKVYPEVNQGQFRADLRIEGDMPGNIRVGQTFPVELKMGEASEAVIIPRGPFYQSSGGKYVYVIDADGKSATRRPVTIGRQNPRHYEVTDGIAPGEKIIISSYSEFGEADKVIITD
ncbi:MAG: HlyD family efflux transporter periplasmic adaptor subunit [Paramuribaculum sp.]|nr:HlyD family efflux transporter periplasmic adaptor subunit [Paramuribaculum sp.]